MSKSPTRPVGQPVTLLESLGLRPLREQLPQIRLALLGDAYTPSSRFDHTSLGILRPRVSVALWAGRFAAPRRALIYSLFNHRQTPPTEGWSVRRTQVLDYRGLDLTYDSHNGTDFAVPPGTPVTATAPGLVFRVSNDFNRGGWKVCLDHGRGVFTTSNHLARPLVRVGQTVDRGEVIALSGYSGLDGLALFPFSAPHVHFNTWVAGRAADPFARIGTEPSETSMWRDHNDPRPTRAGTMSEPPAQTAFDAAAVNLAIASCRDPVLRDRLASLSDDQERAYATLFEQNYYPTRFTCWPTLVVDAMERAPLLDLPFPDDVVDGVVYPEVSGAFMISWTWTSANIHFPSTRR